MLDSFGQKLAGTLWTTWWSEKAGFNRLRPASSFSIHVELRISTFRRTRWACDSPDCCHRPGYETRAGIQTLISQPSIEALRMAFCIQAATGVATFWTVELTTSKVLT